MDDGNYMQTSFFILLETISSHNFDLFLILCLYNQTLSQVGDT